MKARNFMTNGMRMLPGLIALACMVSIPLAAVGTVRAGNENIIEGTYQKSSGAGFVLMVSLQRAQ
ncbi:hypothetical protein [Nitratireductor thuwali]|uniref:Uncharacterized protein n=1 Tax=Nitratireductor thuwali TaxID=2267699 RepID=A0ABY5MPE5_9HYPH|nr:hypothetical protein NTH_03441 [Nitratireductor thuwali]